jgi:hypothetical protein
MMPGLLHRVITRDVGENGHSFALKDHAGTLRSDRMEDHAGERAYSSGIEGPLEQQAT